MPRSAEHGAADRPLSTDEAETLAEAMRAFGAASRLRLLWAMLEGERTVEELSEATGLGPSAASQQLRLLRQGRLVTVRRTGRHAFYRLHDDHVADLLTAIRNHHEHVHPPVGALPSAEKPRGGLARRMNRGAEVEPSREARS
jgi:DNA-binding transcriptional ArsR family regulator